MGVYLLNICAAPPPLQLDRVQSQAIINEQESIIEILVEKVLGFEDAIEDYNSTERENQLKKPNHKLENFVQKENFTLPPVTFFNITQKLFSYKAPAVSSGFFQLEPPPPKN